MTDQVLAGLKSGQGVDAIMAEAAFGVPSGGLPKIVSRLRQKGYRFRSEQRPGSARLTYWLAGPPGEEHQEEERQEEEALRLAQPPLAGEEEEEGGAPGPATNGLGAPGPVIFQRIKERLLAGEALSAHQMVDEYGTTPQKLATVLGALSKSGHTYDHTVDWAVRGGESVQVKRFRLTGRLDDEALEARKSVTVAARGSRPRMPAPQVDMATEVVLVHRVSDDEVDIGIRQGGRQWMLRVVSCIE